MKVLTNESELVSLKAYKKFIFIYGMPKIILYPCCGYDDVPSKVFGKVIYVDKNKNSFNFLKGKKLEVYLENINKFNISEHVDLLLLINSEVNAADIVNRFEPKFVICNNNHQSADQIRELKNYSFVEMLGVDFYLFKRKS